MERIALAYPTYKLQSAPTFRLVQTLNNHKMVMQILYKGFLFLLHFNSIGWWFNALACQCSIQRIHGSIPGTNNVDTHSTEISAQFSMFQSLHQCPMDEIFLLRNSRNRIIPNDYYSKRVLMRWWYFVIYVLFVSVKIFCLFRFICLPLR